MKLSSMRLKNLIIALLAPVLILVLTAPVQAYQLDSNRPNNRFGVHLQDVGDLDWAATLVNSNGGSWGYVTVVIRQDDMNLNKWQPFMDELRRKRLIPLVRIATTFDGTNWQVPEESAVQSWLEFLNSLNWVIRDRYLILFNEPNHAKEWGGKIDPESYAKLVALYAQEFKSNNPDYFILGPGLDTAPVNTRSTMHPADFLRQVHTAQPGLFDLFDGWVSHSYPNPGFRSSPNTTGRTSIQSYLWEMSQIESLGYSSSRPIFITETGWVMRQGSMSKSSNPTTQTVSNHFQTAFEQVWTDSRLVAITPFIINYDHPPFDEFSLIDPTTKQPNQVFNTIKDLSKVQGAPVQIDRAAVLQRYFPRKLIAGNNYMVAVNFLNVGQAIWGDDYTIRVNVEGQESWITAESIPTTEPFATAKVWLRINTPTLVGTYPVTLILSGPHGPVAQLDYRLELTGRSDLSAQFRLWLEDLIETDFTKE